MKMTQGDNFRFDITARGHEALIAAMRIVALSNQKFVGWATQHNEKLIVYWSLTDLKDVDSFPSSLTIDGIVPIIEAWLGEAKFGPEPDHDGDNMKGFQIYNEQWGHVDNKWQACFAVRPKWIMLGK